MAGFLSKIKKSWGGKREETGLLPEPELEKTAAYGEVEVWGFNQGDPKMASAGLVEKLRQMEVIVSEMDKLLDVTGESLKPSLREALLTDINAIVNSLKRPIRVSALEHHDSDEDLIEDETPSPSL